MTRAEAAISLLARIVASPPEGKRGHNDTVKVRMLITMASTAPKGYTGTPSERVCLAALVRQGKCHTRTFGKQTHHFLTDAGRAYVNAILR